MRAKVSSLEVGHDSSSPAHHSFSSAAATHRTTRQPQHLRVLRLRLPASVRIRQRLYKTPALAITTGGVGCSVDSKLPEPFGNNSRQWRRIQKHPARSHQVFHALHGISSAI